VLRKNKVILIEICLSKVNEPHTHVMSNKNKFPLTKINSH
jgi:hypothetical protein